MMLPAAINSCKINTVMTNRRKEKREKKKKKKKKKEERKKVECLYHY